MRTIVEASAALRSKKVSSVELTRQCLANIERLEPKLNAFITVTAEHALNQARIADEALAKGVDRGPLHGIPISLKDLYRTKGIRTTGGSLLYRDMVPDYDCTVAEKLNAAGAVMLGKTGLHELAYGVTSNNPHFGAVKNPWNLDCIPGGSSGGSGAAVSAEMSFMSMGSDTGGSIRIPAAFCGVVGLKPTYGLVSRYGVLPLGSSLDHMGPLNSCVRDAAMTLAAIAGPDARDESSVARPVESYLPPLNISLKGLRIGVPDSFFTERVDPTVMGRVRAMVQLAAALGGQAEVVRVPDMAAINLTGRMILLAEASALLEQHSRNRTNFGADVLALLDQGKLLAATDYVNAQRLRSSYRRQFLDLFQSIDVLLTPSIPMGAPRIGQTKVSIDGQEEDTRLATTRFVRGINVIGFPALSMPCGFDTGGLPIGLQIIGRPFEEATILRVGAALEDATDFHLKRPPVL